MSTTIEWTEETWNPVRGCNLVSPGCKNCYAMRQAHRFSGPGGPYEGLTKMTDFGPVWTGEARLASDVLTKPLSWRVHKRVFVNSMSDLFHEGIAQDEIDRVFAVMAICSMHETRPSHTFQILTKRSRRMRHYATAPVGEMRERLARVGARMMEDGDAWFDQLWTRMPWPLPNVLLGVSVEDQAHADERIPDLLRTSFTKFVSYEPALGPVDFTPFLKPTLVANDGSRMQHPDPRIADTGGTWEWPLDWVIVGGESGPGARPFDPKWAEQVVDQCAKAKVACFVKQMGSRLIASMSPGAFYGSRRLTYTQDGEVESFSLLDKKGGVPGHWPKHLRVREYPEVRHG